MNTKTIKFSIAFLAVAFLLAGANSTLAYVPGVWDPQPRVSNNEPAFTKVATTYDAPVVIQTTPAKTVSTTTTKKTTVATTTKPRTVASNQVTTNNASYVDQPNSNYPYNNGSQLTALSVQGSGSFMPSSIWQWLFVVFLILVIIIIARMLGRRPEHHEVHTVTSH